MSEALGNRIWAFSAGNIPDGSTGHEPELTSRDELCLLNTSEHDAELQITVYYEDRDPVGRYQTTVGAQRVCHLWINNLIDPQAVPLGVPYGLVVHSSIPVVASLSRLDTRGGAPVQTITSGFAAGGAS